MNFSVFRRSLLCTFWLPILGMGLGFAYHVVCFTQKAPEFVATGKVRIAAQVTDGKQADAAAVSLGKEIEILESSRIGACASHRVHALQPEVAATDVSIVATKSKDPSVLNVIAVGNEWKYTQSYLEAVLDEYMIFHRESAGGATDHGVAIVKRPDAAYEMAPDFWMPLVVAIATGFAGGFLLMLGISLIAGFTIPARPRQPSAVG